jgi:hypothetical protein
MPLTSRAKLSMVVESTISLVKLAADAARAIKILDSSCRSQDRVEGEHREPASRPAGGE